MLALLLLMYSLSYSSLNVSFPKSMWALIWILSIVRFIMWMGGGR